MLGNIIVLLIITAMLAGAIAKIVIDKRNGVKCVGCSCGDACSTRTACSIQLPDSDDKQSN